MIRIHHIQTMLRDLSKLHRLRSFFKGTDAYRQEYGLLEGLKIAMQLHWASNRSPAGTICSVKVQGFKAPVHLRSQSADIAVFWQVFGLRHFEVRMSQQPEVIIDAGAHIGLTSVYLATQFPEAQIIALEPNESNFRLLEMNTAAYNTIHPLKKALWYEDTKVSIKDNSADTWAFQVEVSDKEPNLIDAVSVSSLLRQFDLKRVDLLKIDIEGAERELFTYGYEEWLAKVEVMMVELHDRYAPGCRLALESAVRERGLATEEHGEYTVVYSKGTNAAALS